MNIFGPVRIEKTKLAGPTMDGSNNKLWQGQSMAQQKIGKNLQAKFWSRKSVEKIGQPKVRK